MVNYNEKTTSDRVSTFWGVGDLIKDTSTDSYYLGDGARTLGGIALGGSGGGGTDTFLASGALAGTSLDLTLSNGTTVSTDLASLANTDSFVSSTSLESGNVLRLTRNDSTQIDVDLSSLVTDNFATADLTLTGSRSHSIPTANSFSLGEFTDGSNRTQFVQNPSNRTISFANVGIGNGAQIQIAGGSDAAGNNSGAISGMAGVDIFFLGNGTGLTFNGTGGSAEGDVIAYNAADSRPKWIKSPKAVEVAKLSGDAGWTNNGDGTFTIVIAEADHGHGSAVGATYYEGTAAGTKSQVIPDSLSIDRSSGAITVTIVSATSLDILVDVYPTV